MTDFRALHILAETFRDRLHPLLCGLKRNDVSLEIGPPSSIEGSDSVAVILRGGDGTRLPLEILVYSEGLAICERVTSGCSGNRHFIGRLYPHAFDTRIVHKVVEHVRTLSPDLPPQYRPGM